MSAHIPCPDCLRFAVTFTHLTLPIKAELTFAMKDSTGGIFTDLGVTAAGILTAANAHLVPAMDGASLINGVIVEDVRTVPYGGLQLPQTPVAGTIGFGGTLLPTDTAMSVKKISGVAGRSGRGRLYWPIWTSGWQSGADQIDATHVPTVLNGLNDFQTALETAFSGAGVGHISTVHAGSVLTSGVFYDTTDYAVADLLMDSQRRRLLGRGR